MLWKGGSPTWRRRWEVGEAAPKERGEAAGPGAPAHPYSPHALHPAPQLGGRAGVALRPCAAGAEAVGAGGPPWAAASLGLAGAAAPRDLREPRPLPACRGGGGEGRGREGRGTGGGGRGGGRAGRGLRFSDGRGGAKEDRGGRGGQAESDAGEAPGEILPAAALR